MTKCTRFASHSTTMSTANKSYSYHPPTCSLVNEGDAPTISTQIPHSAMKVDNTQLSHRNNQGASFYSTHERSGSGFGYPKQNDAAFTGNGTGVNSDDVDIRGRVTGIVSAGADVGGSRAVSIYSGHDNKGRTNTRSD